MTLHKKDSIRVYLYGGELTAFTADGTAYMEADGRAQMTDTHGWRMTRSGSIVGVSFTTTITSHVTDGTLTGEVRLRTGGSTSTVFSTSAVTINGTGEFGAQATQSRGIDTFQAGDLIMCQMNKQGGGTFTYDETLMVVEVELDN